MRSRLFAAGAGLLVVAIVAVLAWRGSITDEDRIRWVIEDGVAAFNAESTGDAIAELAPQWRDTTSGIDRPRIQQALTYVFMTGRDYVLTLAGGGVDIEIEETGDRARASFRLVLSTAPPKSRVLWALRIDAELHRSGSDWLIVRSEHETLEGRMPR